MSLPRGWAGRSHGLPATIALGCLLWGAPALAQEEDDEAGLPHLGLDWEQRELHFIWPSFGFGRGTVFRPDEEVAFAFRFDAQLGVERRLDLLACQRTCLLGVMVRGGAILSGPVDEEPRLSRLDVAAPVSFEINEGGESYLRLSLGPDLSSSIPDRRLRARQPTQALGLQAEIAAGFLPYQTLETFLSLSAFADDLGPARDIVVGIRLGPSIPAVLLYGLVAPIRAQLFGNERL
jgi:hypothetical protein